MSITKKVNIFGPIGSGDFGVDLKSLPVAELQALTKDDKVIVNINSVGGAVYEGYAIYDFLKTLDASIETRVVGSAMSIASFIFLAGDTRVMTENSTLMMHLPHNGIPQGGNSQQIKQVANHLEGLEDKMIASYSRYLPKDTSKEDVRAMLKAETFVNAKEAKDLGLATKIENITIKDKLLNFVRNTSKQAQGAYDLTTATGVIITFSGTGNISTGDSATIEGRGKVMDETILLADGRKVVFEKGSVVSVIEPNSENSINNPKNLQMENEIQEMLSKINERLDSMEKRLASLEPAETTPSEAEAKAKAEMDEKHKKELEEKRKKEQEGYKASLQTLNEQFVAQGKKIDEIVAMVKGKEVDNTTKTPVTESKKVASTIPMFNIN